VGFQSIAITTAIAGAKQCDCEYEADDYPGTHKSNS